MSTGQSIISLIQANQDLDEYRNLHWSGSFADYVEHVRKDPHVTRTAWQRLYDMVLSYGTAE